MGKSKTQRTTFRGWAVCLWVIFLFFLPDLTQGWPQSLELCGQYWGKDSKRGLGKGGPVGLRVGGNPLGSQESTLL